MPFGPAGEPVAVYTTLPESDARQLVEDYELGTFESLTGIAKGSVNTNYRLETGTGVYFIRIDERRTAEDLVYESALLDHLADRDFPAPRPLRDRAGHIQRTFERKQLMVFPFLPGADKPAHEYTHDELGACGEILARLHDATTDFAPTQRNRFGLESVRAMWRDSREPACGAVPEAAARIDESLERLASMLSGIQPERGTVHGDLFPDNVLFEDGSISGILDFEAACTEALAFDIATAVNALAWPDGVDRPDSRRVRALLDGYRKRRALPAADALQTYLQLSATRFLVTRIRDFVLTPAPDGGRVEKDYRDYQRRLSWWGAHSAS